MCESQISRFCSGERATKLGDGRCVCSACAPFTTDTGPEHDLPRDPHEASGQPLGYSWDMSAPRTRSVQKEARPIRNFDPGHPQS
jgi:hypothetical protein